MPSWSSFLSMLFLHQGWHSKHKCNCNSNSTCSNKITYFVKTCKLAFSQISDSNKASNKASTRINRVAWCHKVVAWCHKVVAWCHKVSNFRCSSRGSSCHNPPCSLCSLLGRRQCRRNKWCFRRSLRWILERHKRSLRANFRPKWIPCSSRTSSKALCNSHRGRSFRTFVVIVFKGVIALLHFVHPVCIHVYIIISSVLYFLPFDQKPFLSDALTLFGDSCSWVWLHFCLAVIRLFWRLQAAECHIPDAQQPKRSKKTMPHFRWNTKKDVYNEEVWPCSITAYLYWHLSGMCFFFISRQGRVSFCSTYLLLPQYRYVLLSWKLYTYSPRCSSLPMAYVRCLWHMSEEIHPDFTLEILTLSWLSLSPACLPQN